MDETPPQVSNSYKYGDQKQNKPTKRIRKNRYDPDEGGDLIECSGKFCKSCTGGLIADCVAICCCPCALLHLLALAFVKAPFMIGKKCFRRVKKKKRNKLSSNLQVLTAQGGDNLEKIKIEDEILEIVNSGFNGGEEDDDGGGGVSARFEAVEKVWLEFYQNGHLGFGRVSFTGIQ
ncbi:uncharacterized protein LOC126674457 [Mercurialis annua]|uniref:uncharacterized protein LOC126674457 n=1 Tax=Mercurialis annua TaxID=3986 RepID=UPI00215E776C|nr:uncharacterized protein LOC126674457 [Mercurialis annua]